MKLLGWVTAFCLVTGFLFAYAARVMRHQLPHRPLNAVTNWGQGRAPESNRCPPGTFRIETDDGFFIECYRGSSR